MGSPFSRNRFIENCSVALILTATIDPGGMILTARTDSVQRLNDYADALSRWIKLINTGWAQHIFFCENSGYPLDKLHEVTEHYRASHRITFLQSTDNVWSVDHGKGHGEAVMLERLLARGTRYAAPVSLSG